MLGFTPGFCYLGGMDQRISMPRKHTPRLKIPSGAVGIADGQNPGINHGFYIRAGDYIQFYPINEDQFNDILREVNEGVYQVKKNKLS